MENMLSASGKRRRRGTREDWRTGAQAFHSLHDDLVTSLEPIVDDRVGA
jgi:hypothetical protein